MKSTYADYSMWRTIEALQSTRQVKTRSYVTRTLSNPPLNGRVFRSLRKKKTVPCISNKYDKNYKKYSYAYNAKQLFGLLMCYGTSGNFYFFSSINRELAKISTPRVCVLDEKPWMKATPRL